MPDHQLGQRFVVSEYFGHLIRRRLRFRFQDGFVGTEADSLKCQMAFCNNAFGELFRIPSHPAREDIAHAIDADLTAGIPAPGDEEIPRRAIQLR